MSDATYFRQGKGSTLNIAAATQVFLVSKDQSIGQARCVRIQVITAGSTAGSANDCNGTANAAAANQLAAIPNVVGPILVDMPVLVGLVIVPGTGQVVAVSYD